MLLPIASGPTNVEPLPARPAAGSLPGYGSLSLLPTEILKDLVEESVLVYTFYLLSYPKGRKRP